jgi:hypothetical protein
MFRFGWGDRALKAGLQPPILPVSPVSVVASAKFQFELGFLAIQRALV